jgi:hypothetical protein
VNSDVEAHELHECLVITETEEVGQIERVVFGSIDSRKLALAIEVTIDTTGNIGKLGNAVECELI